MLARVKFYVLYFISWIAFFEIGRILFLILNANDNYDGSFGALAALLWYGLPLDLSVAGYFLLLPLLVGLIKHFTPINELVIIRIYSRILIAITALVIGIDTQLYTYWGFRIDSTPLLYLETPDIVLKSLSLLDFVNPLLIATVLFLVFRILFNKLTILAESRKTYKNIVLMLVLFFSLILPIRGGVGVAPINISRAYHSETTFLNHAAINPVWNLVFSLLESRKLDPITHRLSETEAEGLFRKLIPSESTSKSLLKVKQPNVLIIVLESFSSKLMSSNRNGKPVTPNLLKIASEGLYFDNIYASGDRTDKGLVSILSGYPSQPRYSIMKFPRKTESLPNLITTLKLKKYSTAFIYAGDINFANMNAYIQQTGVDQIISQDYFSSVSEGGKWGVHDHVMLDTLSNLVMKARSPFFYTALTLSSHEPFIVPRTSDFPLTDDTEKFMNAASYTDEAIGQFVANLKKTDHWSELLLIFIADHGHRLPGNDPIESKLRFRIPMIWTGGAIDSVGVLSKIGSQNDLAKTLLHQLNIKSSFVFSNDLFTDHIPFAYYAYNNGYGVVFDDFELLKNNTTGRFQYPLGLHNDSLTRHASAYYEHLMYDFEGR